MPSATRMEKHQCVRQAALLAVLLENGYNKLELELQIRKYVGLTFGGAMLGSFFPVDASD